MNKILIANRGEIALRVMRTAREMGIKTVAVYSDADRDARFVQFADEAYHIGPAPSAESYLNQEKIIDVAKRSGAEGIHPGYGFLSENANFSRAVEKAGIIFIGPKAESMEMMGSKLSAKEAAKRYNIPLVPGTEGAIEDLEEAKKIAIEIGFPVLIKASAGGGGKGMRIVEKADEIAAQVKMAMSEAKSAFGDPSVFIERYVKSPRHIEIQVLADNHGNAVHLFERECSIQRRHQKVIEEAPSSVLTPELREEMGQCAVRVAQACDYRGVGTVEFLLDDQLNFYFLEMNTRLQVEHPVSELITGLDLVREQIRAARGEKLRLKQEDLKITGHAIEARVYAEDPRNNFLPDIGTLQTYRAPEGPGIRVDDGFNEGMSIPIYYDPMISKLVVHAESRQAAIEKMTLAIDDYHITGLETTLSFCRFAINHEAFKSGQFDTHFVKDHFTPEMLDADINKEEAEVAAMIAMNLNSAPKTSNTSSEPTTSGSKWRKRRA